MKKFTIGSDVEFFAHNKTRYISAIPFIGDKERGTKHNPIRHEDGSTLQRDNVAAEFATAVARNDKEFIAAMRTAMKHLFVAMDMFAIHACATPSVEFDKDQLEHYEAQEFGCDPDFNAWKKGKVNPKPCAMNKTLRTAALHVHVGSPVLRSQKNKMRMIRVMDCIHGVVGTMMDTSPESLRRKELYGKAGAFRPTPYGVEYRVLSNFFASSPVFVQLIYNLTRDALYLIENNRDDELIHTMGGEQEVCGIINSGDSKKAFTWFIRFLGSFLSIETRNMIMDIMRYKPKSLKEEWK